MRTKVRLKTIIILITLCSCLYLLFTKNGKNPTYLDNEISKNGRRVASITAEDIELARKQIKDDIIFERTQPTKQRSTFYKNSNKFNVNVNPTSPVSDPRCPENPVKCDAFKSPSTKPKTPDKISGENNNNNNNNNNNKNNNNNEVSSKEVQLQRLVELHKLNSKVLTSILRVNETALKQLKLLDSKTSPNSLIPYLMIFQDSSKVKSEKVCKHCYKKFLKAHKLGYANRVLIENEDLPQDWEPTPEIEKRFQERKKHLKEACKKHNISERSISYQPNAWEFLINQRYGLIWCSIFKAASSTWFYNFNILSGFSESYLLGAKDTPVSIARRKYPRPTVEELDKAINASSRSVVFMISRHPFERLVSAYRDKLQGGKRFYRNLAKKIISLYPELGPKRHLEYVPKERSKVVNQRPTIKYNAPSFQQFVQFLIDSYDKGMDMDEHWTPMNKFCTPCLVDYDVFAKVETLDEDGNYIIYKSGIKNNIKPKRINRSKNEPTKDVTNQYICNLTTTQLNHLIEIYQLDFELFEYDFDKYKKCAKPDVSRSNSEK